MDTFLVRTLLVPSAVVLIGRWNWWPSALYRAQPAAAPEGTHEDTAPAASLHRSSYYLSWRSRATGAGGLAEHEGNS